MEKSNLNLWDNSYVPIIIHVSMIILILNIQI